MTNSKRDALFIERFDFLGSLAKSQAINQADDVSIISPPKPSSYVNNKSSMTRKPTNPKSESADKNITKMVICMGFLSLIGNLPLAVVIIYSFLDSSSMLSRILSVIANILDILSHSTFFFVYYRFNVLFKKTFHSLVRRVCSLALLCRFKKN